MTSTERTKVLTRPRVGAEGGQEVGPGSFHAVRHGQEFAMLREMLTAAWSPASRSFRLDRLEERYLDSARITCLEIAVAVARHGQLSHDRGTGSAHSGPPRLDIVDLDIESTLHRWSGAARLDLDQSGTTRRPEDRPAVAIGAIPGPIHLEPQNIAVERAGLVVEGREVVEAELVHAGCLVARASSRLRYALPSPPVMFPAPGRVSNTRRSGICPLECSCRLTPRMTHNASGRRQVPAGVLHLRRGSTRELRLDGRQRLYVG